MEDRKQTGISLVRVAIAQLLVAWLLAPGDGGHSLANTVYFIAMLDLPVWACTRARYRHDQPDLPTVPTFVAVGLVVATVAFEVTLPVDILEYLLRATERVN
jgi:hypothetical protein